MATRKRKDVADVRVGREQPDDPTQDLNTVRWWKQSGKAAASGLLNWVDTRRAYLRGYNTLDIIHEAIYEGRPVGRRLGYAAYEFLRAQSQASSYLNVLQSMVDTVVSRIGKRRSMPVIGCSDAEYSEKLYARRASRVLRLKMGAPRLEREMPMMLRDGVVRGDGCVARVRIGGDVHIERFPRSELVFDDGESRNGTTPTLARVKLVDRDWLAATYPADAARIRKLSPAPRDIYAPYDYDAPIDSDYIELVYGWRLPSFYGSGDGRHVIAVRDGGKPLLEAEWKVSRFPISRTQWTPAMRGYYGIGLIQQLAGSQNKVNDLWTDHQEALYWGSALKIFLQRGTNVDKHHMRARHPAIVEYDGKEPIYEAPNPASTQAMDSLRWLIQQMYEISGISQAAAASKNTLGPNASGKALDTMDDIQSDRFSQLEMQYTMGRIDVGTMILDGARELAEDDSIEESDLAPWIREIDWKRFDLDNGRYHLAPEPINFIPDARAGKLDTLNDLSKIPGLFSNPMIMASLFDEPDIAAANRHLIGPYRGLERMMEMLGDVSVPLSECVPTPQMMAVPGLAKEMALGELGNAFAEGAEDNVLGRYRFFLQMLDGEQQLMTQPAAPPPGGAPGPDADAGSGMPPPGPPMPPGLPAGAPPMAAGPGQGAPTLPDPMNGASAQLAAGMTPFPPPPPS